MKKTIQIIAVATLCLFLSSTPHPSYAQFSPLKIGDKLPEKVWDMPLAVLNHPAGKTSITLREYKGQLIIVDFWATWCAACIVNFPKANQLQKELPGKLSFIAVSSEPASKQKSFFESRKARGLRYDFPSVVGNSVMKDLFPHTGIPHYVWIDPDGVVSAISTAERLTTENLKLVLQKKNFAIPVKKDIDAKRPLFLSEVIGQEQLASFSVLTTGNYDGLPSGTRLRKEGDIVRGRALTNMPMLSLYLAAIRPLFERNGESYNAKRLILKVVDPSKLVLQKSESLDGTFSTGNLFNYELLVPVAEADHLDEYMLEDLNRYTRYMGKIESRKVECLVLRRTGSSDRIKSTGGKSENSLFFKSPPRLINSPLSYLVKRLNSLDDLTLPVIDETEYTGNVDLVFSGKTDLVSLSNELAAYQLELKREYRNLNMFVLSDKPVLQYSIDNKTQK